MGQIDANFGQDSVNAVVDLNYNLTGLSFIFPPQGSESDGFTSDAKRKFLSSHHLHAALPKFVLIRLETAPQTAM